MSSSVEKSSGTQSLLSGQNIVYVGIGWAVISLLFFLLFSITPPGDTIPLWYSIGTYILETLPFLGAAILCFRNWRSPQIASGRNVWLGIGLGMTSWFIANLIFGVWELYFLLEPDVSPADLFYLSFYVFLSWGMVLAVLPRRLNLEIKQWIIVATIAVIGIALAVGVLYISSSKANKQANAATIVPGIEHSVAQAVASQESGVLQAPTIHTTNTTLYSQATEESATETPLVEEESESLPNRAPQWAIQLQDTLAPLSVPVNFFYIVGDVFLLIIASTLLLAFWGGRFAQSWRMIAAATFSLYVADMWFKYADATEAKYQSGSLPEVFFVFSGVLFAIGAALEYDVSSRSRRSARKRA
jgi:hypothetical protein